MRLSEDVHTLSYRLHPSTLRDLGLADALQTECDRFARLEATPVWMEARDLPDDLPQDTGLCLFRITKEALRNVARHARATRVEVSLRRLRAASDDRRRRPRLRNGPRPAQARPRPRQHAQADGCVGMNEGTKRSGKGYPSNFNIVEWFCGGGKGTGSEHSLGVQAVE